MALVIDAFQAGDLQTISRKGIESVCLEAAFTEDRIAQFTRRYPGSTIRFSQMMRERPATPKVDIERTTEAEVT